MGWEIDNITQERRANAAKRFPAAMPDILDHIAAVEAALYCLATPLIGLDEITPGRYNSACMVSKFFPFSHDEAPGDQRAFLEDSKWVFRDVPENEMHTADYQLADSVSVTDSSKLHDNLEVIAVCGSADCASINYGSIWMKDIRRAAKLLWPKSE